VTDAKADAGTEAAPLSGRTVEIPTARGDAIKSSELGFALMHEHTFNVSTEINQTYPQTWGDEEQRVAEAVAMYRSAKARGVDSVTDLTVIGLGRFIPRIRRIAEQVDLNIIVATGVYTWHELPMFFRFTGPPERSMDDMFVRDIEEGIGDTGVRAGIIKVATDKYGVTEGVNACLRASARAHRRTGVPITTHTHDIPNGLEQQKVFEEEGVDLSRVVIGHLDRAASHDLDYVERVLANGSFIGIDQFGVPSLPDDARVSAVVELCRRGHAGRIVLSHDHNCFCDMVPLDWFAGRRGWSKTHLLDVILPMLRERGVSAEDIRTMTVTNPRAVFETAALGSY
jgi:phosphotriesterase-related protein